MILKEEFLGRLRKIFGLNQYEVKVWGALLSRGVSTAGELSNIGDVPRSRTYDILESLEKKGFVVLKLGKPIKFVALKPTEVIERVKKNTVREAQDTNKRLDELKGSDILNELDGLYDNGIKYIEPSDLSGALKGRQNVYNHLDMMLRNAQKHATIVTTSEGLTRKYEHLKASLEKAKKRGVNVRIAAPITSKNYAVAKELSKYADIRSGKFKARFALADGKEMMFMVLDDEDVHPSYDVGIWANSPYFAQAMHNLFEESWNNMTPLNKLNLK
ncbi:TrmB family transcriptional regulator [Candidatus Pacearchaeota archaeon]|nr:TrmB family transcriptional regulator [Candidatus Pacearchaeota archaeon]